MNYLYSPCTLALVCLTSLLPLLSSLPYDPSLYSLGNDLIQNGNFNTPLLGGIGFQDYPGSVPGWTCISICQISEMMVLCGWYSKSCTVTQTQYIDLNPNGSHDIIYQTITIPATGKYYLFLEWIPPLYNTVGQTFTIKFNSTLIDTIVVSAAAPLYVYQ